MSGPHTWLGSPLTDSQREHLLRLDGLQARSKETAVTVLAFRGGGYPAIGNSNVLGALATKGFTESKVMAAKGGPRCVHHWLTEAGYVQACIAFREAIRARTGK